MGVNARNLRCSEERLRPGVKKGPDGFEQHGVSLASVRAGNVIGGGDLSEDRLVPAYVKAPVRGKRIPVRNLQSVRPRQHVLDPLAGYLWLDVRMWEQPRFYAEGRNFGPTPDGNAPASDIVNQEIAVWGYGDWKDGASG